MKIAIGSDHAGLELKNEVKRQLEEMGHEVMDLGTLTTESTDYPIYAHLVARAVAEGQAERGVLACGTGIGMCIAANKVPGVRAALPYNEESAALARLHNDANILCLGGRTMDRELVRKMVKIWFETNFEGGRHSRRVGELEEIGEPGKSGSK